MAGERERSSLVDALGRTPLSSAAVGALGEHETVERVTPRKIDTDPESGERRVLEFIVQLSSRAHAVRFVEDEGYRVVASGADEDAVGEALRESSTESRSG